MGCPVPSRPGQWCACRRCRPAGMNLQDAIRRCQENVSIERHGAEEHARRKEEQRQRLQSLRQKGKNHG